MPRTRRRHDPGSGSVSPDWWSSDCSSCWDCVCGRFRYSRPPPRPSAVTANQIRAVSIVPPRGLILDRYGNPLVNNVSSTEITLTRNSAAQNNGVIGRLAALIGETEAQVNASIANTKYSLYEPIPILANAPIADVLYIKEHPAEFPGVATDQISQRNYPQLEYPGPAQDGYPGSQVLGYVGVINGSQLQSHASQGYQAGDPYGQSGLEQQYESVLHGTPGQQQLEVNSTGHVVGTLKTIPAVPGDNLVTNIDTPLQQVADNAAGHPDRNVAQYPRSGL